MKFITKINYIKNNFIPNCRFLLDYDKIKIEDEEEKDLSSMENLGKSKHKSVLQLDLDKLK